MLSRLWFEKANNRSSYLYSFSLLQQSHGSYRRTRPIANAQGKTHKNKALTYYLVELTQVLIMGNPVLAAHHMQWIGTTDGIIETGCINAESLDALFDDPHAARFIQSRILTDILLCAMKAIECAGVEKEHITFTHVEAGSR